MNHWITFLGAVLVLGLSVWISLNTKPKTFRKIVSVSLFFVVIAGLLFYGFGLNAPSGGAGEAVINAFRTVLYTISLFGGGEKFDALMKAGGWFSQNILWQILYWAVHYTAVFVTASALLITWGKKVMRAFRLMFPRDTITVLYADGNVFRYLDELEQDDTATPVYAGPYSKETENKIREYNAGYAPLEDVKPDGKWLKKYLRFRKDQKNIRIVSVSSDDMKASGFLDTAVKSLQTLGISSKRVRIYVRGEDVLRYEFLAERKDSEGNLYVSDVYTQSEIAAHTLMNEMMPYKTVEFDYDTCRAKDSFRAMVIGFGDSGQDALRYLVRYGQFLGSEFEADVLDSKADSTAGLFRELYEDMMKRYRIRIHNADGFSREVYSLLTEEKKMNYIVICTGDQKTNLELLKNLETYKMMHPECFAEHAAIAVCTKDYIEIRSDSGNSVIRPSDLSVIFASHADISARNINDLYYRGKVEKNENREATAEELANYWYKKDPMDRLSSISSAEFIPTFYACAGLEGKSREEVQKAIEEKLIHVLPELEHLRWNAFESSVGVKTMSEEEFRRRAENGTQAVLKALKSGSEEDFLEAKRQFGKARKDLGPYGLGGIHVCLTDWDRLDDIWKIYFPYVKKYNELLESRNEKPVRITDFKELDEKNIWHMLDL